MLYPENNAKTFIKSYEKNAIIKDVKNIIIIKNGRIYIGYYE